MPISLAVLIVLVAASGALNFTIVNIVLRHGYKGSIFSGPWQAVRDFKQVMADEDDPGVRRRYRVMLHWYYALTVLTYLSFIVVAMTAF